MGAAGLLGSDGNEMHPSLSRECSCREGSNSPRGRRYCVTDSGTILSDLNEVAHVQPKTSIRILSQYFAKIDAIKAILCFSADLLEAQSCIERDILVHEHIRKQSDCGQSPRASELVSETH